MSGGGRSMPGLKIRPTVLCCLLLCLCACSSDLSGETIACHVLHQPFFSDGKSTYGIQVMNGDGGERAEIGEGHEVDWSPDGRQLVFVGSDSESLHVLDLATGKTTLLAHVGDFVRSTAWSPDGETIVFMRGGSVAGGSIWVIDADGSSLRQLTEYEFGSCLGAPSWSPDGSRIAFSMSPDCTAEELRSDIYVMRNDGSNFTRLTDGMGNYWNPVWSPRKDRIAFNHSRGSESWIYVIDGDGSQQTRLGTGRPYAWSPDGSRIYFHMVGDDTLWEMDSDGSNPTRLFKLDCERPVWSPVIEGQDATE